MRSYRIKVDHTDTWYHCYNRAVGSSADRPLGRVEKEQFVRILHRVSLLYGVRVVSYQVMSNHFHLLVHAPVDIPSATEMCRRYRLFHRGRRQMEEDSPECLRWRHRSRDISWFMRHLQHLFTVWYNRTRPVRRRGSLWADRFKHTILESGKAVWSCWKYIESNPVRAKMVACAGDYRFSSYGIWRQSGLHPFSINVEKCILPAVGARCMEELLEIFTSELAEDTAELDQQGFSDSIRRRVRYWTDGLVIGSALFIRGVMSHHHHRPDEHRLAVPVAGNTLLAWRRLRLA